MLLPRVSLTCAIAFAAVACSPTPKDYSWERLPASQLQASSGLVLGTSVRGKIPAKLSIVCTRDHALHVVVRGKLPSWGNLSLPMRGMAEMYIDTVSKDSATKVNIQTVQENKLSSSVSERLPEATTAALLSRLSNIKTGKIYVFGIRETLLYFNAERGASEVGRFARQCSPRAN